MVTLTINGEQITTSKEEMKLLDFLREELGLIGAKNGCSTGHCGSCTVIIDGKATRSCLKKVKKLEGAVVETIEGIGKQDNLHPLQIAFLKQNAYQCGFCTPGIIMSVKALLDKNQNPTVEEIKNALKHNICRCTGYKKIVEAVLLAASIIRGEQHVDLFECDGKVGDRAVRIDGINKVMGRAVYTDDYKLKKSLQGKMLFSEYPHAKILSIDIEEAKKMPGVAAIALYEDVPGRKDFGQGLFTQQPVIAGDIVRFVGDPVAVVYAESEEQAYAALGKINVEYEPLPIITTIQEALAKDSYPIYEDGNVLKHIHTHKGDVKRGFAKSDVIVEQVFNTQCVDHGYLEPDAAHAQYDEKGRIKVYGATQSPKHMLNDLCACLGLSEDKVVFVTRPNGGAFGGREEPSVHIQAALGTLMTGRPVRMVFTREELNKFSVKRHAMRLHYKLGATKDGKILAIEVKTHGDTGAYASSGEFVLYRACAFAAGPYTIPNACIDTYAVYTNNVTAASMRGFGSTQPCVAMETTLDILAEKCGVSPIEIRRINGLDQGKQTVTGHVVDYAVGFQDAITAIENEIESEGIPKPSKPGRKVGIGYAGCMKNVGLGCGVEDAAWAQMRLEPNGKITILAGGVECGQGHDTIIAQIAAEEIGVSMSQFNIAPINSEYSLDGGITTASRLTFVSGNAVRTVSSIFRDKMLKYAAKELDISVSTLEIYSKGIRSIDQKICISFGEFAKAVYDNADEIYEKYYYIAPKTSPMKECSDNYSNDMVENRLHFSYCFGVQAVIIEVDESTGETEVLRVFAAHDVGKAINPALVEGQIEGGVAMGIGYALSEEFVMKDGYVESKTFGKLGIPDITQIPTDIRAIIIEDNHPYGPYGAKGMAELPLNATAPAILNAIYNAVGIRVEAIPINPKKLAELIKQKKEAETA